MSPLKTTPFDASEYIEDDDAARDFLLDAMESGDARVIAGAIGDVARAKGMSQLARETGMSRESLYRALSEDGNPQLATVLKVLEALGLKLTVEPKRTDGVASDVHPADAADLTATSPRTAPRPCRPGR